MGTRNRQQSTSILIGIVFTCLILPLGGALAADFVGSSACSGCHSAKHTGWSETLHANLYREANSDNIISPWEGDVTLTDSAATLTLTLELDDNGGDGPYTVTMYADPEKTIPLLGGEALEVIRSHGGKDIAKNANDGSLSRGGGAGENVYIGKQRYHVEINGAEYILPNQWNHTTDLDGNNGGWVNYHLGDWIDSDGNIKIEANNAKASEARRCAGCHRTGIDAVTHDGSVYVLEGDNMEDNIACEACHGPGSDHTGGGFSGDPGERMIVNPALLTKVQQVDLCGSCHSRGHSVATIDDGISTTTTFGFPYLDRTFRPGDVWGDLYVEGGGYWGDGVSAKQHHQQYEEYILSDHYDEGEGLTCTSCHEMHGTEYEHDLLSPARGVGGDTLCATCHIGDGLDFADEAAVVAHTDHSVGASAPDCTNCHMPAVAKSGVHYDIHSHTFEVLLPQGTLDNAMPNSCAILCHRGAGPEANGGSVDELINTWTSETDIAIANWLIDPSGGAVDGPPVLGDVADNGDGTVGITWTNPNNPPAQFIGFAWDLYTEDWVERGTDDTMWYNFSSAATSGELDLGNSGAYFIWISNQYADSSWFPCENPAVFQNLGGMPHTPLDVATAVDGQDVTLSWKPDMFGTWLYWIIAYDIDNEEWVEIDGPLGESVWQYVVYNDADFNAGSVNLTVPDAGDYWFFIGGMAWDAETFGEFGSPEETTSAE